MSELAAALAVVVSLVFVGLEVRQNTMAIQSAAAQAVNETFAAWYSAVQGDRDLLSLSMKGMKDYSGLSDIDKAQFIALQMPLCLNAQNAFYKWREGSLSSELWHGWELVSMLFFTTPGGNAFWKERSYLFGGAFQDYVERDLMTREPHPSMKPWGASDIYE